MHLKEKGSLSQLFRITPAAAGVKWITRIPTPAYVKEVEASCRAGKGYLHSEDTPISARSYEAARLAAGLFGRAEGEGGSGEKRASADVGRENLEGGGGVPDGVQGV